MNRRDFTAMALTGGAVATASFMIPRWATMAQAAVPFEPGADYWLRTALRIDGGQEWVDEPVMQIHADDGTVPWSWNVNQWNEDDEPHCEILLEEGGHAFGPWAPLEPGRWNGFTWHVRFSADDEGLIEGWRGPVKLLNLAGPNLESNHSVLTYTRGESPFIHLGRPVWRVS